MNARMLMRLQILALLLFCGGLGVLLFPTMLRAYTRLDMQASIARFSDRAAARQTPAAERATVSAAAAGEAAQAAGLQEMQNALSAYNAALYESGQQALSDPFAYEQAGLDMAGYGVEDGVIGVLRIERMALELPILLGATKENLKRGAALLGQTSIPIGGENTNAVLAAHRGYSGAAMFRNIERLRTGDLVVVESLFGMLRYRVCETRVIEPDDIGAVLIQHGRDLVTLITCHPYGENAHRYVAYCERSSE